MNGTNEVILKIIVVYQNKQIAKLYFLDEAELSSKSGTPSPMVARVAGGGTSSTDLRDLREGSYPRSVREGSLPRSVREGSVPRSVREGSVPRSVREGSLPRSLRESSAGSADTADGAGGEGEDRTRSTSTLSSLGTRYTSGKCRL